MAAKPKSQPQSKPAKKAPKHLLVPTEVRKRFDELAFCIDVELDKAARRELHDFCGVDEGFFAASTGTDLELAVQIQSLKSQKLHVTVEFRKGLRAPFNRLAKSKLRNLIKILEGGEMELVYVSRTRSVRRPKDDAPTALEGPTGEKMRLAALELESDEERPNKGIRISFRKDGALVTTRWFRLQKPASSFANALKLGLKEGTDGTK